MQSCNCESKSEHTNGEMLHVYGPVEILQVNNQIPSLLREVKIQAVNLNH